MDVGPITSTFIDPGGGGARPVPAPEPLRPIEPPAAGTRAGGRDSGDPSQREAGSGRLVERNLDFDPATHQLVLQVIDAEHGELIRQTPDVATMRLRAYARELNVGPASEHVSTLA